MLNWTEPEVKKLKALLMYNPTSIAAEQFMDWQKTHSEIDRPYPQVKNKAARLRKDVKQLDGLSLRQWCRMYSLSRAKVRKALIATGFNDLPGSGASMGVKIGQIIAAIKHDPSILAGKSLDRYRPLMGDRFIDTFDMIDTRKGRPVLNVDTGERYDTCRDASKAVFVTPDHISKAASGRYRSAAGFRWKWAK